MLSSSLFLAVFVTPAEAQYWDGPGDPPVQNPDPGPDPDGGDTTEPPDDPVVEEGQGDDGPPKAPSHEHLAWAHAPVHHQEIDDTHPIGDYLAPFDYDGDLIGTNNWENLTDYQDGLVGTVYYSVTETCTHWFIVYAMYHPQDWAETDVLPEFEHENDMEGLVLAVRKDGTFYGTVEAMITVSHVDFYSYAVAGSGWVGGALPGGQDLDGTLFVENIAGLDHVVVEQEGQGHGLKAGTLAHESDQVVYRQDLRGSIPTGAGSTATYELVDLFETLWLVDFETMDYGYADRTTFSHWGTLHGDQGGTCGDGWVYFCESDRAHLPWAWDDADFHGLPNGDGYPGGLMALDPARLFFDYFDGTGDFSLEYVSNQYAEDLKADWWHSGAVPLAYNSTDLDSLFARVGSECLVGIVGPGGEPPAESM